MIPTRARPKSVTLLQAFCAVLLILAILTGGVAAAWLAGQAERSAVDLLIAGRLIGL